MARIERTAHRARVEALLREFPVVALLGARQVGKTTLARELAERRRSGAMFLDLEDRRDLAMLDEPTLTLGAARGLVILDEVQRRPDLFEVLRVLADRPGKPARFLVLGSASPNLLRQGSETLAGRIAFHELGGLGIEEVGPSALDRLWLRGGFPRSFVARSQAASWQWREEFIRTFLERDLPSLGLALPPVSVARFWTMLAHWHGQVWNGSEFGRAFGVSHTSVRKYLDLLIGAFAVVELAPWFENTGKRLIKSPKIYLSDSGILHSLLGVESAQDLSRSPKVGASWEGFLLGQTIRLLRARPRDCFFWGTHAGGELDLVVVRGRQRLGFEFKRTDAPRVTPSMSIALETLGLQSVTVVHAGSRTCSLAPRIRAVAATDLVDELGAAAT